MTTEEIFEQLKNVLVKNFELNPEDITLDANIATDLDLDSIDAIDLVVRLQQETGKKVDPESFRQIRTLGDVTAAVVKLVNG